jgi:hypothetical protein
MNTLTAFVFIALITLLLAACSERPTGTVSPKVTDLGILEVSDGESTWHDLGDSRACVISPTVLANGSVRLTITIQQTNSDGTVRMLASPTVQNMAGQKMAVSAGDIHIRLIPAIKK